VSQSRNPSAQVNSYQPGPRKKAKKLKTEPAKITGITPEGLIFKGNVLVLCSHHLPSHNTFSVVYGYFPLPLLLIDHQSNNPDEEESQNDNVNNVG
jgi:hypothetical protein